MRQIKLDRIPCEVLGCRRTASKAKYGQFTVICCGKCWVLGAREDKKAYRDADRFIERHPADHPQMEGAYAARHQAFLNVVAKANEARAGLA